MKKWFMLVVIFISGCSLMFRGDGGISLVGTLVNYKAVDKSLLPIHDCFYSVYSFTGREVYSDMQLYREGNVVSINLTVAPTEELYTVKIYCSDVLVKEVVANSADKEPTDIGNINASQT